MSRKITDKHSFRDSENALTATDTRLLITSLSGRKCAVLFRKNRILRIGVFPDVSSILGTVFLGKIKNIQKNICACFVEIADREIVYLPISDKEIPFLTNRRYDGRLLEGDEILVQTYSEAQKTKQASVTSKISISGRYFVFTTGNPHIGLSSRLDSGERERIRTQLIEAGIADPQMNLISKTDNPLIPSYGLVIRTEAAILDSREFLNEFRAKESEFLSLMQKTLHASCFSCLYSPTTPLQDAISQLQTETITEVVTDLSEYYDELNDCFCSRQIPVRFYQDINYPLKTLYSLEHKLNEALERRIWLKSGAYLVFDITEALCVFDVNTGKYSVRKASAETFLEINLEAAEEIVKQIQLRNLSGIILVDFINMKSAAQEQQLLSFMKELCSKDPITTNVIDMTALGLMEITRKKQNRPLHEIFRRSGREDAT